MGSVRQIEKRATAVLESVPDYIWDGESLPVPVEDIADSSFGLLVRDVDDLRTVPGAPALPGGQSLSGLLLPTRGEIWVNTEETRQWPPRRRFTIGHELGHWCLHRVGDKSVFCRSGSVQEEKRETSGPPPAEEEANVFAAALLMPDELLRREWDRLRFDLHALMTRFDVSKAAMQRRLDALGLETR